jgi:hypothetical protein
MSKNVEISAEDWQRLIDLHEELGPLLMSVQNMLQYVGHTSNDAETIADAGKLDRQLDPISKLLFVSDPPFGLKKRN